jgi:hypothetical protein
VARILSKVKGYARVQQVLLFFRESYAYLHRKDVYPRIFANLR